jgi:hypothetical protein
LKTLIKIPAIVIALAAVVSCSNLTGSDMIKIRVQLISVKDYETAYLVQLGKVKSRKEYTAEFMKARQDILYLVNARNALKQASPGLKSFSPGIRSLPSDFKDEYIEIFRERRDISGLELKLMKKFKARDLDTPEVYTLGKNIKKAAFIDD